MLSFNSGCWMMRGMDHIVDTKQSTSKENVDFLSLDCLVKCREVNSIGDSLLACSGLRCESVNAELETPC